MDPHRTPQQSQHSRASLVTCLWLTGRAEEAARFYVAAFQGYRPDSSLGAVHRSHLDVVMEGRSVLARDGVLSVDVTLDGQPFVVLNAGGEPGRPTDAVSVQVLCENQQEVDHFADRLSADGGREVACGWITDRFGVRWQVVPRILPELLSGPDPDAAARVQAAMMGMRRLSIEVLMDASKDAHGAEEE